MNLHSIRSFFILAGGQGASRVTKWLPSTRDYGAYESSWMNPTRRLKEPSSSSTVSTMRAKEPPSWDGTPFSKPWSRYGHKGFALLLILLGLFFSLHPNSPGRHAIGGGEAGNAVLAPRGAAQAGETGTSADLRSPSLCHSGKDPKARGRSQDIRQTGGRRWEEERTAGQAWM